jgi:hypothetical protein
MVMAWNRTEFPQNTMKDGGHFETPSFEGWWHGK